MRDELDEAGIAQRERVLYEKRSFRRVRRGDGCSRFILEGDLETSAWLDDVYDKLTSPRRGGPRFVDPADTAWAERIATDPRTTEQYLHDAVIGLLRKGVDTDLAEAAARTGEPDGARTPRIVGSRVPSVRVLVTEESLRTRTGHGRIEGTDVPVSIETVERIVCTAGSSPSPSVRTGTSSTWAASHGSSPLGSGSPSPHAMADASGRDATARRAGRKPTTSTSGREIVGERISPTACSCADITTCSCTTTTGRSSASARPIG
jgi:hypothetical protein